VQAWSKGRTPKPVFVFSPSDGPLEDGYRFERGSAGSIPAACIPAVSTRVVQSPDKRSERVQFPHGGL